MKKIFLFNVLFLFSNNLQAMQNNNHLIQMVIAKNIDNLQCYKREDAPIKKGLHLYLDPNVEYPILTRVVASVYGVSTKEFRVCLALQEVDMCYKVTHDNGNSFEIIHGKYLAKLPQYYALRAITPEQHFQNVWRGWMAKNSGT